MRSLLFVVILGLVAVVRSSPDNNLAETQDEVYREAVTDGYLINHPFALTTESPQGTRTVQAPQQLSSDSQETEGSGDSNDMMSRLLQLGGEHYARTTQSVLHTHSFQHLSSESKERDMTEGSGDNNDMMSRLLQHGGERYATTTQSVSHTHSIQQLSSESKESDMTEGSGDYNGTRPIFRQHIGDSDVSADVSHSQSSQELNGGSSDDSTSTSPSITSTTEVSTTSSNSKDLDINLIGIQAPSVDQEAYTSPESHNIGHNTPSWIIITGFVVGVASLVMVCVAIATRDKWNGPSQAFQPQTKTDSSNQQMELEMETFLQRDQPRENGQANEYTVIPLEELPEKNSSH